MAAAASVPKATPALRVISVIINDHTLSAEVADTDKTRTQGLSGRTTLAADHAMLFAYAHPGQQYFWMIDMQFPLDIVFLDGDKHVLSIASEVEACIGKDACIPNGPAFNPNTCRPGLSQSQCPLLPSPPNTQYVLELPAGSAKTLGMQLGTPVSFTLGT